MTIQEAFDHWWEYQKRWNYVKVSEDEQQKIKEMFFEAWNHGRKFGAKKRRRVSK